MLLRRLLVVVVGAVLLAACGTTHYVSDTPLSPSKNAQAAPGHPCDPAHYYMQCAYGAAGQNAASFPGGTFGFPVAFGIDFGWGGPSGGLAQRGGARFALSYLSGSSKDWSYTQLRDYLARGIKVGFVWETAANRAVSGYSAGRSDAYYASRELARYGISQVAIFFAVDLDTSASSVASYFAGARSYLGTARTGVYGGYYVVVGLRARGLVGTCWQTIGWSYGHWSSCPLEQFAINRAFYGSSVDFNRSIAASPGLYPAAAPRLVCFGPKVATTSTCRQVRARAASYRRAGAASGRAFRVRRCDLLAQRDRYFSRVAKLGGSRQSYRRGALLATRRAEGHRACSLFASRVGLFTGLAQQLERKYG